MSEASRAAKFAAKRFPNAVVAGIAGVDLRGFYAYGLAYAARC